MPITEAIASRVPAMIAKQAIDSQAKLVATESVGSMAKDALVSSADAAGGALAKSAENPGPIAKGFWWGFDKVANVVYNAVHKAAYGH